VCVCVCVCVCRRYVGETDEILFEDWFHCTDLGTQLKPVIEAFMASNAYKTQTPERVYDSPGVEVDTETKLSDPINFEAWCEEHTGTNATMYDGEYRVAVMQAPEEWPHYHVHEGQVFLWQMKGEVAVHLKNGDDVSKSTMSVQDMMVIPAGTLYRVEVRRCVRCWGVSARCS